MTIRAAEHFPASYASGRQRFREGASRLGWGLSAHSIGQAGPQGEDLAIDVAISRPGSGRTALVVSSGLHGVEGFFGSAVQHAAMTHLSVSGSALEVDPGLVRIAVGIENRDDLVEDIRQALEFA